MNLKHSAQTIDNYNSSNKSYFVMLEVAVDGTTHCHADFNSFNLLILTEIIMLRTLN